MNDWAITTTGLGKRFRKIWAVHNLDLKVPQGAVFGFLGPNGSGKTTTIQMLMGLLPPTEGTISVLGMDPVKDDVPVKRKVGYVAEKDGFYEWMTVDQIIRLVAPYHKDWDWQLSDSLVAEFGLDRKQKVKALSKGTRAKLVLLLALSFNPEMLVLDEPTGGLDPAARRSFIESILARFQESEKTIFVSSHLLNEFAGLIDHVAFLKESELKWASSIEELHAKIKRVRMIYPESVPKEIQVPGLLTWRANGREGIAAIRDFDRESSLRDCYNTGAREVTVEEMSLEDIFVDLVGR